MSDSGFSRLAPNFKQFIDESTNSAMRVLLILLVASANANLLEDILYASLAFRIFPTTIGIENGALGWSGGCEGDVDAPGALVVDYVHANFSNLFGRTSEIEVVVLGLEIFSKREKDSQGELVKIGGVRGVHTSAWPSKWGGRMSRMLSCTLQ